MQHVSAAVHRNTTMQGPHYTFKDGQWATAHMREHPKVQITISVDRAQAHGESTSVRATNVTAMADTGAQVNVWSLDKFVKYDFSHDILTLHPTWWPSIISPYQLWKRSLPSLKGCCVTVMLCNAGLWFTLAPTFRPSSYRTAHCRRWGSCPPVSHHWAIKIILALALNVLPCHHPQPHQNFLLSYRVPSVIL